MLISSGTGMALDAGVGRYRGFALLAIAMTGMSFYAHIISLYWCLGLTGSIGAIHANRLSTFLHTIHHQKSTKPKGLTGPQSMLTLWLLSFPTMGCFYAFVYWVGWIDVSLGLWGWVGFAITVSFHFDGVVDICWFTGNHIVSFGASHDLVLLVKRSRSRVSDPIHVIWRNVKAKVQFVYPPNTFRPSRFPRSINTNGRIWNM